MADEKHSLTEPSHSNMTSAGVFRGSSAHLPRIFHGSSAVQAEKVFWGLVATRWPPSGPPPGGHPVACHPVATRWPGHSF